MGSWNKGEISRDELIKMMSGGAELDALSHELQRVLDEPIAPEADGDNKPAAG
jgi:hypothetical protein